jgi:hypothetical protein
MINVLIKDGPRFAVCHASVKFCKFNSVGKTHFELKSPFAFKEVVTII